MEPAALNFRNSELPSSLHSVIRRCVAKATDGVVKP